LPTYNFYLSREKKKPSQLIGNIGIDRSESRDRDGSGSAGRVEGEHLYIERREGRSEGD
jgi:hypothetical protein